MPGFLPRPFRPLRPSLWLTGISLWLAALAMTSDVQAGNFGSIDLFAKEPPKHGRTPGNQSTEQNPPWEKISDEQGVIVYHRQIVGSPIIGLRGETIFDAAVAEIFAIMKDNARASRWMPLVGERRDLKNFNDNDRLELMTIKMPWPLTDRYYVERATAYDLHGGGKRLILKSIDHVPPEWLQKDMILADMALAEFILTPIEGGRRTHVTAEIESDPRGAIPTFIVNAAQRNWPVDFFSGLNRQLHENHAAAAEH